MTIFRDDIVLLLPPLRAFARSLTAGDRHFADDLVQDTLVNALRAQHQFAPGTNLKAWLFTILRNRFHSMIARKHVMVEIQVEHLDSLRSTPAAQETGIEMAALRHAFGRLSAAHREVLALIVMEDLSYAQLAEMCGCAIGTVKSRVSRARKLLKKMLLDDEAMVTGPRPSVRLPAAAGPPASFGHVG